MFCFFPYLDVLGLGTDTQPNALVLAAIILLATKNKRINKPIILLWLLFILSLFLIISSNLSGFESLKNSMNYLSPAIIVFAAYNVLDKYKLKVSYSMFVLIVLTYLLVGLVQLYIYPEFLTNLVNGEGRGILMAGRGVVSLCPEPAFYGSMCLFLVIFSLLNYSLKRNLLIIPLLLFQIIFLLKSSTASVILIASLAIYLIIQVLKLRIKYMVLSGVIAIAGMLLMSNVNQIDQESRMGSLMSAFIENPLLITQVDASVGVRLTGAYAPVLSAKHNYFLPMGLGNYQNFLRRLYAQGKYRKLLSSYIIAEKEKLGGSINMVLFQLGFLGLLLPLAIYFSFRKLLRVDKYLFCFLLFFLLLFTQIQLMHSMIGFLIAIALVKSNSIKKRPSLIASY